MANANKWTKERVALLKRRLDQRVDRADIAAELRVSTSALNGKIYRLGLSADNELAARRRAQASAHYQSTKSKTSTPRPPQDEQSAEAIRRIEHERDVVGVEDLLTLQDRPDDGCCFPVGDPKEDDRVYCPNKRVPFASYCEFHMLKMYPIEVAERLLEERWREFEKEREYA